ncbi:MAG: type II toxin-antitoxin system VapC family toxin [Alphaproteobacteria bacterium]|nr:type II toxin-antitoxin system VapC family toxin [Alphaproteobacteria bacterium]
MAALLFGEPDGDGIAKWFEGARLIAPTLIGLELANACLKKIRRQPDRRAPLLAAFDLFGRMEIEQADIDPAQALRLVEVTGPTAYDAAYLWLAN